MKYVWQTEYGNRTTRTRVRWDFVALLGAYAVCVVAVCIASCTAPAPSVPWPRPPAPPVTPVEPPPQQSPPPVTGDVEAFLASIVLGAAPPDGGTPIPGGSVRWFVGEWMVSATTKDGKVTGKSATRVESNP